ncbi:glycosyltransferase family 87 protein [Herbiconiux sp. L3-i23]|uniref:glycosyltransferase family 87 protein n=1 Tax=Herbiconiux sp. L3-i23 TaxID=2905871 RepID=UPI002060D144|nr:glycosyltransferase family 87 protein [Herbiconiux sp. L3-i23]BDI23304.1 hypothetical protein L3i23_20800 [Herbiconiux sp. L3-i23]
MRVDERERVLASRGVVLRTIAGPVGLAVAFLAIHGILAGINLYDVVHFPFGDVTQVYRFWMEYAADNGVLVGIDTSWVYPIGALLPMGFAYVLGPDAYGQLWLATIVALDAVATVVLARRSTAAAWWWMLFLACLGPVSLARIDAVTAPLAILAVVWLLDRPVVAGALLALATWIKVWPVALIGAAVLALRSRLRIVIAGAVVTAAILVAALALGARGGIFGFILEQTGRGLQVEAPVASWWLWSALLGLPEGRVYYDTDILTYQVAGPGTAPVAALMTPLLVLVVAGVAALGALAVRRGQDRTEVLVQVAMALVLALIVVNKVGSPQFIGWLAAPAILAILHSRPAFRGRALAVLAIAAATQFVYPWAYDGITAPTWLPVLVLTARNIALVVLLVVAVAELVRLATGARPPAAPPHALSES